MHHTITFFRHHNPLSYKQYITLPGIHPGEIRKIFPDRVDTGNYPG